MPNRVFHPSIWAPFTTAQTAAGVNAKHKPSATPCPQFGAKSRPERRSATTVTAHRSGILSTWALLYRNRDYCPSRFLEGVPHGSQDASFAFAGALAVPSAGFSAARLLRQASQPVSRQRGQRRVFSAAGLLRVSR